MKKIKSLGLLAAIYMAFAPQSFANVTVRAAGGGNCLNVSPGAYTSLTDIIITEVAAGDFAVQAGTTLILTAPAGFEFQAGAGTVSYTAGMDITATSISVTASTITVTMTVGSNTKMDVLRIRNIRARATSANAVGKILRTATGGTATIAGDNPGAGVNHGSLTGTGLGATFTSVASGNWSNPAIWSGGVVPSCTDNVSISHSVTADMTASVNDVTVTTGGTLVTDNAITVGGTFALTGTGAYTHNNMTNASTTIFAGTEAFDNTSTIVIQKWYDRNIPFATSISGDLGNVTFNYTGTWSQDGLFAPAKVKGTLTIASGTITLDDGTGMTTALTLQDVVVTSAGNLFVQSGAARDLTLVTGNFTDNSTAAGLTSVVYRSIGNFSWTVNGNLAVSHRFSIMEGNAITDVGSAAIDITGDLTISGGQFDGLKSVTGPLTIDVAGNTVISGSPTYVYFKKNYAGDFTFSTTNLTVSGGAANYFLGSTTPTGAATYNIANDLTVTGASTKLWMNYATTNTATTDLNIGNDLIVTNAEFTVANHLGSVSMDVTRNIQMSGATSYIYGQRATNATGTANLTVNGNVTLSGGTFMQSRGLGNASTTITEYIDITGATFYGINNTAAGNNGLSSLSCSDITLNGGKFYLHRSQVTDSRTVVVDVSNDVNVNFTASTDEFAFISRAASNNAQLDLNIGGNLYLSGNTGAYFTTSVCTGTETVDIAGDVVVSGGKLRFNGNEFTASNGHNLTGVINGSLIVSGGSVCLSINRGTVIWTIAGDYNQTGGYVFHRYNSGDMTVTVNGDYTQSNGVAALYARPSVLSTNNQALVINGDATFDNATMIFDSSSASTATHTLYFRGANVIFGDNTVFTHIGHLTTSTVFGSIRYDRIGTINWNRLTSNFDMQHVKQSVTSGTTLDVSGSANDMLIASHSSATSATHTSLTVDGTLDMGTLMITGRSEPGYYSRAYFSNGSRLITAHTGGLYSGSASNSCIYPMIGAGIGMDYYLGSTSTVEYNGTDTQVITGTGLGLASTVNHRYGYLDINFQGTPDIEFAYPYDDNIYVRTGLVLTSGELNLDNDHITATGGRVLNILNGASITRSSGYIRSETEDGSGAVNWNITTTGSFVFPFGYNSVSYIPFTFQSTSGSAGDVLIGTYRSASDNTPYPPTVSHVHDIGGADNSGNTVDRFWRIEATGSVTANMLFSYVASEGSGVANPRAQLWEPVSAGWFPPAGGQSNPTGTTTQTNGNTTFNSWWTLSSSASPLPIQLLSFTASPVNRTVKLAWSTATEINNSHFTVQRSDRGDVFTDVLHVAGAGNSTTVLNYYAIDNQPLPGISYYRLKQTDYDGRFTYSNVRVVYMNNNVPVSLFPNPFRGTSVQVAVGETEKDDMEVNLYDLAGKKIESDIKVGSVAAGGVVTLDFGTELAPGAYMIEIKTTDGNFRQRIVKQ